MAPGRDHRRAAAALIEVTPLVARWIERVLAADTPPLTVTEYLLLRAVQAGAGGAVELAAGAAVSEAAVSLQIGSLEAAGLLARTPNPGDRRRRDIVLTGAGRAALSEAERRLSRALSVPLAELPPHEAGGLAGGLQALRRAMVEPPPPRPRHHHPPRPGPHHRPRPHPPKPPG
jgi:DNA-binding MarR family transcriptional regulator